jgi:hypothetical protein
LCFCFDPEACDVEDDPFAFFVVDDGVPRNVVLLLLFVEACNDAVVTLLRRDPPLLRAAARRLLIEGANRTGSATLSDCPTFTELADR